MAGLIACVLLPLAVIGLQIACGANGAIANSSYKLTFLLGPLWYCSRHDIRIGRDILKLRNWRRELPLAVGLGVGAAAIFLGAYAAFGKTLVDEQVIVGKIQDQFSVSAATVLSIAPFTILINSFLEEFFYRGFAYGLLVRKNPLVGTLLPAAVFTVQHLLFIYHWVGTLSLALAIVGLTVFALVVQWMYTRADSIVAPWVVHVGGDLAMMVLAARMLL